MSINIKIESVTSLATIKIGTEIKLKDFYTDLDKFGVAWTRLPDSERRFITTVCNEAYTPFAFELKGLAAALAVLSANPKTYRNPVLKPVIYRRSQAGKWVILLFEMYINESPYIWERRTRQEAVTDLLNRRVISHPVLKYLEDQIDDIVVNHYLGCRVIDDMIHYFEELPRDEWRNKIESVKGEVISLY
nr:MAG TPA: hypothetical protein [Caudoviricetes sp.]